MGYVPIERYGLIGDLGTCALVSDEGSVDWCCFPHLESASAFAAILDDERGGRFAVRPSGRFESEQRYVERTNVLQTEFSTPDGSAVLTDFMPIVRTPTEDQPLPPTLVRRFTCTDGAVDVDVEFCPRFDYARATTVVEPADDGVVARGNAEQLNLRSTAHLEDFDDEARATPSLERGDTVWYHLRYGRRVHQLPAYQKLLDDTVAFWREWCHDCGGGCAVAGEFHDVAVRSSLTLKVLTHQSTGAIAAAPTTSLPEKIGGVRNWDYRFSWLRDASLTIRALVRLGCVDEAEDFFEWWRNVMYAGDADRFRWPFYQPLYGLHGEREIREEILDHLEGYRKSSPVRIGNAASRQLQLDVYGELVLCIYEMARYHEQITDVLWQTIEHIVDFVCNTWEQPDSGIWEVRSEPRQFVHSKVMCWVAVDRAIRLANHLDFDAPVDRWRAERDLIKETVLEHGFDEAQGAFVRSFGSNALDAAALRMPILEFLPPDDPRIEGTVDAVIDRLATDDGLVYRYFGEDGLPGDENPFFLCSFWLVQSLVLIGRVEEARETFENLLRHASPLGLIAEEFDPESGEHRGNYPQAFSHIGLINCAAYLNQASSDDGQKSNEGA